jgi:hypothetical protein
MGAIEYTPGETETVSLKAYKQRSRGLSPEEKRVQYALDRTKSLREKWKATIGG